VLLRSSAQALVAAMQLVFAAECIVRAQQASRRGRQTRCADVATTEC
jgi:hypothetical protein